MSDSENAFVFKITVIGDGAVGKTSLIKNGKPENLKINPIISFKNSFIEFCTNDIVKF